MINLTGFSADSTQIRTQRLGVKVVGPCAIDAEPAENVAPNWSTWSVINGEAAAAFDQQHFLTHVGAFLFELQRDDRVLHPLTFDEIAPYYELARSIKSHHRESPLTGPACTTAQFRNFIDAERHFHHAGTKELMTVFLEDWDYARAAHLERLTQPRGTH